MWVTLTYADGFLPRKNSLNPKALSSFVKDLRNRAYRLGFSGVRYFGVGEYGSLSGRPHYHLFLFNLPPQLHPVIGCADYKTFLKLSPDERAKLAWPYGTVQIDPLLLNPDKVVRYTIKYTLKDVSEREALRAGRVPEFLRCSNRPPIGGRWIESLGASLSENKFVAEKVGTDGDVPGAVAVGHSKDGKPILASIGRTLRRRLRSSMGYPRELSDSQRRERDWIREKLSQNPAVQSAIARRRREHGARLTRNRALYPVREKL